jgi:hypothetical protein
MPCCGGIVPVFYGRDLIGGIMAIGYFFKSRIWNQVLRWNFWEQAEEQKNIEEYDSQSQWVSQMVNLGNFRLNEELGDSIRFLSLGKIFHE